MIPELRKSKGNIVNIASDAGLMGVPGITVYCGTKGGVVNMSRAMALEIAPDVRVNCICPGYVDTDMIAVTPGMTQNPSDEPYYRDWTVWPVESFGGTYWNYNWERHSDTAEVKLTQHADDFIKGDHEFRFGVQYNRGGGSTQAYNVLYYYLYDYYGPDYVYEYLYTGLPYYYGGESESWGAFVSDSWAVSSQVTLELGVRYDTHKGWVNDFPRLDMDSNPTGEIIPGADYIDTWSNVDPRLGFAWNIGGNGKNVLRASAGLFHAELVSGDWYSPPPDSPVWAYYWREPNCPDCEWNFMRAVPPPPRAFLVDGTQNAETMEYTLGFEHQLTSTSAIGISVTYKDTTNLLGWYIDDDGEFEWATIIDDQTGEEIELMDYYVQPTRLKGNSTGPGANGGDRPYEQEYLGIFLTYNKRFSNNWDLMASYSYSESTGMNPRFFSGGDGGSQGSTFYSSRTEAGTEPIHNSYEVGGFSVSTIAVEGTLLPSRMGGGPSEPAPGSKLVGAVVEGPGGPWFFKVTGSAETVAAAEPAFDSMLRSARP